MKNIYKMIMYELRNLKTFYQKVTDRVEKGITLVQYTEWLALRDSNIIGIGLLDYEGTNRALREAIQKNVDFNIDFISNDLLSLLHELGHMQTIEDYEEEFKQVKRQMKEIKNKTTNCYDYQVMYYDIIIVEKVANEWASDYINNNKQLFVDYAKKEKTIAKRTYKRINEKMLKNYNAKIIKVS